MPMPPSWASAMASRLSVTVSMAADTSGRLSSMLRVRRVFRSWTSRGMNGGMGREEEDIVERQRPLD
jgi:hypothetical protein